MRALEMSVNNKFECPTDGSEAKIGTHYT